jgi:hypothetical protein
MLPARSLAALLVTGSLAMTGAAPVAASLAANNPGAMRAMTHQVRRHRRVRHCRDVRRHGRMVRVCTPRRHHHHHHHRRGVMTP